MDNGRDIIWYRRYSIRLRYHLKSECTVKVETRTRAWRCSDFYCSTRYPRKRRRLSKVESYIMCYTIRRGRTKSYIYHRLEIFVVV